MELLWAKLKSAVVWLAEANVGDAKDDSDALVTTVLSVDCHEAMAELWSERTEGTPEATVALGGMPVMMPLLFVMVV